MTYLDNCERYWECTGCYVELADGLLHIWIDGPEGERTILVPADEQNIAALDAGDDPTDGWEDGNGNAVCYGNGHSAGYVLVVEDMDWRVYPTYEEAESEAEDMWDRMSDRAKDETRIFQVSKCDDLIGGIPADDWDMDESCVRDFVREWEEGDERISEVSADMRIGVSGHSMVLKVTEQARMLGVGRGDIVSVTIRRKD